MVFCNRTKFTCGCPICGCCICNHIPIICTGGHISPINKTVITIATHTGIRLNKLSKLCQLSNGGIIGFFQNRIIVIQVRTCINSSGFYIGRVNLCGVIINNMWVAFNFQNVINKLIYTLTKLNHGWIFDVVVYNSIACRLERHVIGNDLTKCIVKRKHIILSCARYKNIICNVRSIQHGTGNE